MGFLSGLGRALGAAGSVFAAPFTGGTSLAALGPILGTAGDVVGSLAGGASKNRQAGRAQEAILGQRQDQNILDFARFNEQAPNARLGRAGRADMLQGLQNFQRAPSVSSVGGRNIFSFGGNRDALFQPSQGTLDLADLIRQRDLQAQQRGDLQPRALPQSGKFDTFLNTAAGAGGILGGIGDIIQRTGLGQADRVRDQVFGRNTNDGFTTPRRHPDEEFL